MRAQLVLALSVAALLIGGCGGPASTGASPSANAPVETGPSSGSAHETPSTATVATSVASAPPSLDTLPAWTAPTKCLGPETVQRILGTGRLTVDAATKTPVCDYSEGANQYWYWVDNDLQLVDPKTRDTSSATFVDAPDLGQDALRILARIAGGREAHGCHLQVRLDRDHGVDTAGYPLTTLNVSVGERGLSSKALCAPALKLLNAVSRRTAFAPGFTPSSR